MGLHGTVVACTRPAAMVLSGAPVQAGSVAMAVKLPPVFRGLHMVVGLARRAVVAGSKGMEASVGVSSPVPGISARRVAESLSAVRVVSVAEPAVPVRCVAVPVPRK